MSLSTSNRDRLIVVEGKGAAPFAANLQARYEQAGTPAVAIDGYFRCPLETLRSTKGIVIATMNGPGGRTYFEWRSSVLEAAAVVLLSKTATQATVHRHTDPSLRGTLIKLSRKVPNELQTLGDRG